MEVVFAYFHICAEGGGRKKGMGQWKGRFRVLGKNFTYLEAKDSFGTINIFYRYPADLTMD